MATDPAISEVTVLGAGVMGAAIAAHLANAGLRVRLLDIVPKDAPPKDAPPGDRRKRNAVAMAGLEGARKAKPAAFFSPRFDTLVTPGNLE
ncbi:MAG TPA: 3-hydroxyacyl-CoA dehydrogenase NAD-binding domain-containing protein, partial [Polyangia bacterium]|nr:3-hydroxyacyl-CoA dehydrogenase NAD-binding domain-containing protein [Polyangia bacterium]